MRRHTVISQLYFTLDGVDYSCPAAINVTFWTGGAILSTNCTSISILQDIAVEDNEVIFLSLKSYFSYANISVTRANATLTLIEDSDSKFLKYCSSNIHIHTTTQV